jgi:RimJ/RimL family protein N-acetyltransferase
MANAYWPLFGLTVRTPTIELRYPDDALVVELAAVASEGIHEPSEMPFAVPWTDAPVDELGRNTCQYHWRGRGEWTPDSWRLDLAVLVDGHPVGQQGIVASEFASRRAFESGSWLGRAHQGRGIGKEMRAAMLHLGFAGLGALEAHTGAWHDNAASLGVTRALGYRPNGERIDVRRSKPQRMLLFRMPRADWEQRRRDDIVIEGLEPCLDLFGVPMASG